MAFRISWRTSLTAFKGVMRAKHGKLKGMTLAHKKISIYLDQWTKRNMKSEGGLLSDGAWKPFKAGGRRKGGSIDTSAKLLQDTGTLRLSLLPFHNRKTAGIGSSLKYAKTHELGLGNVPQRRLLPRDSEVRVGVRDIFKAHVKDSIGGSGL